MKGKLVVFCTLGTLDPGTQSLSMCIVALGSRPGRRRCYRQVRMLCQPMSILDLGKWLLREKNRKVTNIHHATMHKWVQRKGTALQMCCTMAPHM